MAGKKDLLKWLPTARAPKGKQVRARDRHSPLIAVVSANRTTLAMHVQVNNTRRLYSIGRYDGTPESVTKARTAANAKLEEFEAMRTGRVSPTATFVMPTLQEQLNTYITLRTMERNRPLKSEKQLRDEFAKHFGAMLPLPCSALTPQWMQQRITGVNKPHSRALSNLRSVLRLLVDKEYMEDPFALTGTKVASTNTKPGQEVPLIPVLQETPERIAEALAVIEGYPKPALGMLAKMQLFTGRRVREVANLKWDDLDFDKRVYTVREHKTDRYAGDVLIQPMSDYVHAMLAEWKVRREALKPGNPFVFYGHKKGQPLSQSGYRGVYQAVAKLEGFDEFTSHQLRKFFVSKACDELPPSHRLYLTGHREKGVTQSYSFLSAEQVRASLAAATA